jgi:hypothetical protein
LFVPSNGLSVLHESEKVISKMAIEFPGFVFFFTSIFNRSAKKAFLAVGSQTKMVSENQDVSQLIDKKLNDLKLLVYLFVLSNTF